MPRRVPRRHPSATGAPPAPRWGWKLEGTVGWVEFLRDPTTKTIMVADVGSREELDPTYGSGLFDIVSRDYNTLSPRSCACGDDGARLALGGGNGAQARAFAPPTPRPLPTRLDGV